MHVEVGDAVLDEVRDRGADGKAGDRVDSTSSGSASSCQPEVRRSSLRFGMWSAISSSSIRLRGSGRPCSGSR